LTLISTKRREDLAPQQRDQGQFSAEVDQDDAATLASRPPVWDARAIAQRLSGQFAGYGTDLKRSLFQLVTTGVPFLALLVIMGVTAEGMYWLTLLLAVPTAGLLVRLFILQHDCGHGSFFRTRFANDMLGRALSVLTLTPYGLWKQGHAIHHATNGNLDRRGHGDIDTLTVREYEALSPVRKMAYRLYRNPFVMVLLGAPIHFIVMQRLPIGRKFRDRESRLSIVSNNLALVVVFGLPVALVGVMPVLTAYLPVMIIASWIGNWLFYVQHQFEDTYWEQDGEWNFHTAAIQGSSYFELPPILRWFSGNIGLHHVHHMCSRIPNYRLQDCLDAVPELRGMAKRITLRESLKCWRLALWDENRRMLVSFRDRERPQAVG
jgi:omega-6 fatty acid desaturase (delta-12 desaturase)